MGFRILKLLLVCVIANPFVNSVSASIIERSVMLNLATLSLPTSQLDAVMDVEPFTVDVGDTLIFHLQFIGGRLNIKDSVVNANDYIGLQFLSNPVGQSGFLWNGHWYFEGVSGDLLTNNLSFQYGGPIGGFTANTNLTDTSFSLSGLTFTAHVTYKESGRPSFTADSVRFTAFTGGRPDDAISRYPVSVPVPEPSAIILLSAGLAGLALYRRRMIKA